MPRKPANWMTAFPLNITPKIRKRLPKMSAKRLKENRIYVRVKREWRQELKDNGRWYCSGQLGGCTGIPENSPHHFRGRNGKLLCNRSFFMPLCKYCHTWVHAHIEMARILGLICPKGEWGKQPV